MDEVRKKRYEPQRLADVIPQLMARRGYARVLAEDEVQQVWRQISGRFEPFSRSGRVRGGVLQVVVGNSLVIQELMFEKQNLLRLLQQALPNQQIRDLRFTIGTVDE
jgi:predicted nucleic acid-binding Zn ribbon protein